jgi:hypothetical protein
MLGTTRRSAGDTICYRLEGISVDPERLRADYERLRDGAWVPQDRYANGITHWTGLALYSVSGEVSDLRCAGRPIVRRTAAGDRCAYVCDELLPQFGAPLLRVALYRLEAHTHIGEHRDYGENRTMGFVRVHIPIVTNDAVVMYLEDRPYRFLAGEAWYFDASCRHRVDNAGDADRIHLIVDLKPSPQLERLLKPLTLDDRIRFAHHRLEYYRALLRTAGRFVRTREGRRRIAVKLAQLARPATFVPGR